MQRNSKTVLPQKLPSRYRISLHVDDEQQIRSEFRIAHNLFDELKAQYFADAPWFCERSWGMSHDYLIAIEEGSTMVRVGTTIFGPRVY